MAEGARLSTPALVRCSRSPAAEASGRVPLYSAETLTLQHLSSLELKQVRRMPPQDGIPTLERGSRRAARRVRSPAP